LRKGGGGLLGSYLDYQGANATASNGDGPHPLADGAEEKVTVIAGDAWHRRHAAQSGHDISGPLEFLGRGRVSRQRHLSFLVVPEVKGSVVATTPPTQGDRQG